jgi:polar amino acid transport system substrate-binding protein
MEDPHNHHDTLCLTIRYNNGSIGTISYFANGAKTLPKEYIEIHQSGLSAVLDDFMELRILGSKSPLRNKSLSQDKGHKNEVQLFINALKGNKGALIPFDQLYSTSLTCLKAIESLQTGNSICL